MNFIKMQGLGNDFIIVEEQQLPGDINIGELAYKICDRNFGVGADGLIIVCPSEEADIRMRIINSDGSEAEMCGNGIRCFARYVYEKGLVNKTQMEVETLAGLMKPVLNLTGNSVEGVTVNMNEPHLQGPEIPVSSDKNRIIGERLDVEGEEVEITAVSMGNPHCIIFVGDISKAPVTVLGPLMEKHSFFPRKTNVEFVEIINRHEIAMRVWERGASETLACGTGACAALVAAVINGLAHRDATVHLAGGDLEIRWDENDNNVYMTGPAENVFTGEYII